MRHRQWFACVAFTLAAGLVVPAGAQTADAAADPGPAFAAALARKKDAETLLALSAEGRALYERDAIKLSGYAYCGQALALAEQGELRQSIRAASKALHLSERDRDDGLRAVALRDLAIAYSYAGVLDLADQYAAQALAIRGADAQQVAAPALKVQGDVALRRDRFDAALAHYRASLDVASDRYRPLVLISLANAYTAAGEPRRALEQLDAVGAAGRDASLAFFLRSRGNARLAAGELDSAEADFRAVAADAARPDADYHRLWAFEGLARVQQAQRDPAAALASYREAVALSNRLRARFRSDEFKTGLFGDVQRIFDAALALSIAQQDFAAAWEVSEASRTRALLDTVRNRAVDTLSQRQSLAELQATLDPGDAVLQYHAVGDRLVVWTIRRDTLAGRVLPLAADELGARVDAFRASVIERRADTPALAQALHAALVAPAALGDAKRVYIVPHGPLHYLPFQALHDGQAYFVERHALAVWPSASVGALLVGRAQASGASLLGFGNPATDKNVPLPGAQREVQTLSTLFARNDVYFERDATKARFKEKAGGSSIVHVAAHAEVDAVDPLFSRILFSTSLDDSGLLEAREIFGLDLRGVSLVTLSACESGLGRVLRGEEIVGFTRSFLSAGALSVIASLWPVADESTEALMSTMYRELVRGADLTSAMQAAQLALQRNRRFAHPFFWAPFYVIGNGQLKVAS